MKIISLNYRITDFSIWSMRFSIQIWACSHLVISNLNFSWARRFGLPYSFPFPSFWASSSMNYLNSFSTSFCFSSLDSSRNSLIFWLKNLLYIVVPSNYGSPQFLFESYLAFLGTNSIHLQNTLCYLWFTININYSIFLNYGIIRTRGLQVDSKFLCIFLWKWKIFLWINWAILTVSRVKVG